jgi:DNA-binding NarL/FixJ family response regulator
MPDAGGLEPSVNGAPECAAAAARAIRVLVADDHVIVRTALIEFLNRCAAMEVVGAAVDGEEAVALTRRFQPDVVLMDVTMPRMNGIDATRRICYEMPKVCVIGLSMHSHDDMADQMIAVGAVRYLRKDGPTNALAQAIRDAVDVKNRQAPAAPQ